MSTPVRHFHGRYLALDERGSWEYATRVNAHAVAVIVPVTEANELVLVEQFRVPVQCRTIELPAGLVGDGADPDEPLEPAAHRELLEETGFRAATMQRFLDCPSSAGMTDEAITFFLATGLTRVAEGGGDETEDITVHVVPLEDMDEWLAARLRQGLMLDPKLYAALYWLGDRRRVNIIAAASTPAPARD
ncbi:NUDIX hydrolase [Marinihelvus fidelis]|uniref:GDP-mannose pyrophosphatase n=1 Tax=Marinihelvus fidelis TaxID=2613842 RepID=A0A5N0TA00_9GAMM|nr:NUDIX hydrolase [Marinihelvus fidelis]KAA9130947.1 NUDIX hydrolase [Marinihelvus fidelis]